jgi:hypothetical protein
LHCHDHRVRHPSPFQIPEHRRKDVELAIRRENPADDLIRFLTLFDHPDHVAIPERSELRTRSRLALPINDRAGGDEQKYANQPPIPVHNTPTTREADKKLQQRTCRENPPLFLVCGGLACGIWRQVLASEHLSLVSTAPIG